MRCPGVTELPPPPRGREGWPWTVGTPQLPPLSPDGSPWPRLTVVTPSRNQGAFIEETIRSALLQGYPDLEYLVVDGGSTDDTLDIVGKYDCWLSGWTSERDRGQSHAINKGFARATGTLLGWLNSDDVLLPGALATAASLDVNLDERVLIAGLSEYRDRSGTRCIWAVDAVPSTRAAAFRYFSGCYFAQPSVFFTSAAWRTSGPLDEALHYAMDLDLWLRIAEASRIVTVEQPLSWMRQHGGAKTWRDPFRVIEEVELVLRRHATDDVRAIVADELEAARRRRADVWIERGRDRLRQGCRTAALVAASRAVVAESGVAWSRGWLGLVLRALAPARLM